MTYMHDLEQKLRDRLESFAAGDISTDAFIAMLKKSHLESYHNGQAAGPRPAPQSSGQPAQSGQPGRREWQTKNGAVRTLRLGQPIISRNQYTMSTVLFKDDAG
jgi:hypothetical protein